jgi:hypothetical protein
MGGHYGSEEATTASHRRMVVRGCLMRDDQALLIFVVVRIASKVLGSCVVVDQWRSWVGEDEIAIR